MNVDDNILPTNSSSPIKPKKSLPLEKVFNIAFFEKDTFENFLNFDVASGYECADFKGRTLLKPSPKLKDYHKFINDFIFPYLSVNETVVFSYRKGSRTYDAVSRHSESKVFFNTDIQNFFPSITRDFAKLVLLDNLKNIPISDINNFIPKILDFVVVDNVLPVGFSTSPSFSNASLYTFDCRMFDYCQEINAVYTRYSDDIIISTNNDSDLNDIYRIVAHFLSQVNDGKFLLNKRKTKIVRRGNKIKLLGMVILPSGKISVDIKTKNKIEHLIHFYLTNKESFKNAVLKYDKDGKIKNLPENEIIIKGVGMVSGILNHINTIDQEYLNKLRRKYGNVVIDMFFHQNAS
ncbi:Retron-type reverse transcriptase [Yersinia frederiksenii]|nr:Retron-type reverse transcriptase [Yersinia frederiksenii]